MVSRQSSAPRIRGARRATARSVALFIGMAVVACPLVPVASTVRAVDTTATASVTPTIAKSGTSLTVTVTTSADISCVIVAGQTKTQSPWVFTIVAGAGNGTQNIGVTAYKNVNCNGANVTTSTSYLLDNIAPTITASRVPGPNASGWNNTSVAVNFTCSDANPPLASCGPNAVLSSQGANQSVTGVAVDRAGNTSSTAVSNVNIDLTAPSLSGAPTTAANANGWYSSDVSIHWTCADALSGLATACPSNSTITGEGSNLSSSASIADRAGNTTNASSPAVRIDRTAPVTVSTAPPAWNNTNVTVTLTATDALSGVGSTNYSIDGGPVQTGTSILFNTDGDHLLQYWSIDRAGNTEPAQSVHVKIDKTSPTIGHAQSPLANVNGWNNTPVTVSFSCADTLSGVKTCTAPTLISTQGANQSVIGTATDVAGNTASDPATVSIDLTAPTVTAAPDRSSNANGWYAADVTVTFTCADTLSGVDVCPGPVQLGEGANQSAHGSSTDAASNSATAAVSGINIDKTAPSLVGTPTTPPDQNGFYRGPVTIAWTCTDALSGIAPGACPANSTITGNGDGLFAGAMVTDRAGNVIVASSAAVNIDQTAPTTTSNAPSGWQTSDVIVTFNATDDGPSNVAATFFQVDGADPVAGTSVALSEGKHVVAFWSVDNAGNTELHHTVNVDIDESAPTITHVQQPAPNANGWNNGSVLVTFSCTDQDQLSGLDSCVPSSQYVTADGAGQTVTGTATDVAGNSSIDTATVNVDQAPPTITANVEGAPNANGWYDHPVNVDFSCLDQPGLSGIATCPPSQVVGEGTGQSVVGTASDHADNTATAAAEHINVDTTAPVLSGAATTTPNGAGWYRGDVTIDWSCADGPSGIDGPCPAPTTLTGEGTDLTVARSVTDLAGNSTTATSPAVSIDRHAPITSADAPTAWMNQSTTVHLDAHDALSGVDHTWFILDGEPAQSGTSVIVDTEGVHTLEYWSTDNADNEEDHHTATIEIDLSNPDITSSQSPEANGNGWNNSDVTVTFTCNDQVGLSGIASCSAPQTVVSEGLGQEVIGEAIDHAGNTGSVTHTVNIDKTAPAITSSISESANAAGWYHTDVHLSFSCSDDLSGLDTCTAPATLVEGADQSVTGTAVDDAGNNASTTVNHIDIDTTPPTIDGSVPAAVDGWYNADVAVHWTCADSLSGVAACPDDSIISGEGSSLAASAEAVDVAGNTTSGSLAGIHIDRTAPTTSWAAPSGWTNTDVTAHLAATDNLSGVAHSFIEVDGGTPTVDADVNIAEGAHTVRFWSVDVAGNVEPAHTVVVRVDKTAPTIGHTQTPAPNAAGWNNSDVMVEFACADSLSGIASCSEPSTIDAESGGTSITGTAVDHAGNQADDELTVRLDKTAPTVVATPDRPANGNGWYNAPVVVGFQCADDLSNVADCPAAVTLTEGAGQTATGTGHDVAGNASSATVDGINIDATAPLLSGAPTVPPNANGWYNGDVQVHWTCSDAGSGIDGQCPPESTIIGEGTGLVSVASVNDLAGNTTTRASAPTVRIDRTPPVTTASAPAGWVNDSVTVDFSAVDGLSGVDTTHFSLDGGPTHDAASVQVDTEGDHTLAFWSTDAAGNDEAVQTIAIRIDRTAPTISHSQNPLANQHGWNRGDVTITFTCGDTGGAGVASCTDPQTVTGEGQNIPVTGSAADGAGNVAHDVAVVNIDRTAPTIEEAAGRPSANTNGWYHTPVTISFACTDQLSGIDTCSAPVTVGDGHGQTVHGHATDNAGNGGDVSINDLNVDTVAPLISGAPTTAPNAGNWYDGDVVVHWTCSDVGSGIDGSCPADTTISGEGTALSATASITDRAGNSSAATVSGIHIDRTAPTTTDDASSGWHHGPVTTHFSVNDNLSGGDHTSYTIDGGPAINGNSVTVGEGNHMLTYWSTDKAGNVEAAKSLPVLVDTSAPTIVGAATTAPNANGWYRGPITVHFTCADQPGLSGIASCPADITLAGDGANQSVTGTATDNAGNQTTATVTGLNLDRTAPTIAFRGVANGAAYTLGSTPTPSCIGADGLSGLAAPCVGTVTGGNVNGVGQFKYSATVVDRAGNNVTASVTFKIGYRFDGFLQPINDTAHRVGASTSVFKAGSTVPVKFQLRRADGTVVQAATAPQWLTPVKGASMSAALDESLYAVATTNGDAYRSDAGQYIYNWGSDKNGAGFYWRIGVRLDDGSTYYVNIGLR
jgi:large repetitive protein